MKKLNYSYDTGEGEAYIYLLKAGCPNKADIPTLQKYSVKIQLSHLYDVIYGAGTYEKYIDRIIEKRIQESQKAWKMKDNGGKRK